MPACFHAGQGTNEMENSMWERHPLREGDRIIDDSGQLGHVYSLSSLSTGPDGVVTAWSVQARYDYDQERYGETRLLRDGELSKILPDGTHVDL